MEIGGVCKRKEGRWTTLTWWGAATRASGWCFLFLCWSFRRRCSFGLFFWRKSLGCVSELPVMDWGMGGGGRQSPVNFWKSGLQAFWKHFGKGITRRNLAVPCLCLEHGMKFWVLAAWNLYFVLRMLGLVLDVMPTVQRGWELVIDIANVLWDASWDALWDSQFVSESLVVLTCVRTLLSFGWRWTPPGMSPCLIFGRDFFFVPSVLCWEDEL
jgi:hypothetical protein